MAVPKATVDKDNCMSRRKHQIGPAWQPGVMQTVAKACSMQSLADQHFGASVLAANARHHATSCFSIDDVCHDDRSDWTLAVTRIPISLRT